MLDLSVYSEETSWEVKTVDGKIIHIKQPTFKQLKQLEKMANAFDRETDANKEFLQLVAITEFILNNNSEKESFNKEYIENKFNISMLTALFFGYMSFAKDIMALPN